MSSGQKDGKQKRHYRDPGEEGLITRILRAIWEFITPW
jgi:hypothetical protein